MRKLAVIAAAVAVLGATTAAVSVASASAAPKNGATSSVKVLHLISHQRSLKVIDLGKKGPSPGDEVIETTADFRHGTRVDRSVLTCVLITIIGRAIDVLCHGDLAFADGQVQFQGETNFHTPFRSRLPAGPAPTRTSAGSSPWNGRSRAPPPTWRRCGWSSSTPIRAQERIVRGPLGGTPTTTHSGYPAPAAAPRSCRVMAAWPVICAWDWRWS